eukprot:3945930-Pleurochrysis_carterae.AAC.1
MRAWRASAVASASVSTSTQYSQEGERARTKSCVRKQGTRMLRRYIAGSTERREVERRWRVQRGSWHLRRLHRHRFRIRACSSDRRNVVPETT